MKKYIFTLIVIACGFLAAQAQMITVHKFILTTNAGSKTTYLFVDHPECTFEDNFMTIETDKSLLKYDMGNIKNITFATYETPDTGVDQIDANEPTFLIRANSIDITGIEPGIPARIHNISGQLVAEVVADASGCASLDTSNLSKGVYIVTAGNNSFKFIK